MSEIDPWRRRLRELQPGLIDAFLDANNEEHNESAVRYSLTSKKLLRLALPPPHFHHRMKERHTARRLELFREEELEITLKQGKKVLASRTVPVCKAKGRVARCFFHNNHEWSVLDGFVLPGKSVHKCEVCVSFQGVLIWNSYDMHVISDKLKIQTDSTTSGMVTHRVDSAFEMDSLPQLEYVDLSSHPDLFPSGLKCRGVIESTYQSSDLDGVDAIGLQQIDNMNGVFEETIEKATPVDSKVTVRLRPSFPCTDQKFLRALELHSFIMRRGGAAEKERLRQLFQNKYILIEVWKPQKCRSRGQRTMVASWKICIADEGAIEELFEGGLPCGPEVTWKCEFSFSLVDLEEKVITCLEEFYFPPQDCLVVFYYFMWDDEIEDEEGGGQRFCIQITRYLSGDNDIDMPSEFAGAQQIWELLEMCLCLEY
jgi:hypothetical protein